MELNETQLVTLSGEELAGWFKTPKFIRALDPTDKSSAVRRGLRAIDPSSKSSVTRGFLRELDPTSKKSSMGRIFNVVGKASAMMKPKQQPQQMPMMAPRSAAPSAADDYMKYLPAVGAGILAVALLKKKKK